MILAACAAAIAAMLATTAVLARPPLVLSPIGSDTQESPAGVPTWMLAVALGAVMATLLVGSLAGLSIIAAASIARRVSAVRLKASSEGKVIEQIPDAVAGIAAGMRAGLSLSQAIAYSAHELDAPLSTELGDIVERVELGMSLDQSIGVWASDGGSEVRLTCSVLQLHRRTGGELPRVLERVASTLEQRREAAREARSLTAQARLSGAILGFLPIGFFGFMYLLSPEEMSQVVASPAGLMAIGVGLSMQGLAFLWIRSLLKVEA
jgi:tight adherence protein B